MSGIIIISIPPNENQDLSAQGMPCTALEKHLLYMLEQVMTGRDNGYSIEVKESDG